jgi:hypothetical protein
MSAPVQPVVIGWFMTEYDEDEPVKCGACGAVQLWDECDVGGACSGNVFCSQCNTEIDGDGEVAMLCGTCEHCERLIADGSFEAEDRARSIVAVSR